MEERTPEIAVEYLEHYKKVEYGMMPEWVWDTTIKALEQEPCEDAISKQAVDELSKALVHTTRDKADFLCNFWEGLRKLPSVKLQEPKTGIGEQFIRVMK